MRDYSGYSNTVLPNGFLQSYERPNRDGSQTLSPRLWCVPDQNPFDQCESRYQSHPRWGAIPSSNNMETPRPIYHSQCGLPWTGSHTAVPYRQLPYSLSDDAGAVNPIYWPGGSASFSEAQIPFHFSQYTRGGVEANQGQTQGASYFDSPPDDASDSASDEFFLDCQSDDARRPSWQIPAIRYDEAREQQEPSASAIQTAGLMSSMCDHVSSLARFQNWLAAQNAALQAGAYPVCQDTTLHPALRQHGMQQAPEYMATCRMAPIHYQHQYLPSPHTAPSGLYQVNPSLNRPLYFEDPSCGCGYSSSRHPVQDGPHRQMQYQETYQRPPQVPSLPRHMSQYRTHQRPRRPRSRLQRRVHPLRYQ